MNTWNTVYVERRGVLEKTNIVFKDNRHLMHVIDKIVSAVGRRIDESSPMVDARLKDGSRVNVIIPPLAIDGPILSIRRFGAIPLGVDDLLRNKALTQPMVGFVERGGAGAAEHRHLRRHGLGQDDAAELPLQLHLREGAHRDH